LRAKSAKNDRSETADIETVEEDRHQHRSRSRSSSRHRDRDRSSRCVYISSQTAGASSSLHFGATNVASAVQSFLGSATTKHSMLRQASAMTEH
jgi:hypothetical protein